MSSAAVMSGYKRSIKCIVGPMKVPFLTLPPVCVFLGTAAAMQVSKTINIWHVILVLVGALTAHMSVNALNEYCDFLTDLDNRTTRTPFSGGSGTLPENPGMAWVALATGVVTLLITAAIGLFFLYLHGMALLPIGLLGILLIIAYTPRITHQPALCLIAPGLGFGPLMVVGTQIALTGHSTPLGWIVSMVLFFLVNNLLLLNQFPDVEPDRSVGRRHILILLGTQRCSVIYTYQLIAAYLVIPIGVLLGYLPAPTLLGLATILIAVPTVRGVARNHADIDGLKPYMAMNVLIDLATPVLIAVGLLIAK